MKKYLRHLFVLFIMIFSFELVYADSYGFYIDTDTNEVKSGDVIEVRIYVDSISDSDESIDYFNTGITFDDKVFELANDASDFDTKKLWYVSSLKKLDEGVFFNVFSYDDAYIFDESWGLYGDGKYDLLVSNIKLRVKNNVEDQTATIYVTDGYDEEGEERRIYYDTSTNIKINNSLKEKDNDTFLSTFSISGVELEPKFDKTITDYFSRVTYDTSSVSIDCTCEGNYCETEYEKENELEVGHNVIKVIVTAEDGSTRTYSFVIIREGKSDDSTLASLTIKDNYGSPLKFDFNSHVYKYDIKVKNVINKVSYEAICSGVNCKIDNEKSTKDLVVGNNEITIKVTAEDGNTSEYKINIEREEEEKSFFEKNLVLIIIIFILIISIVFVVILLIKNNKKDNDLEETLDSIDNENIEE